LIEGDLYLSPSPHWRHQDVALNIATIIKVHLREHDTGRVYISPMDVILDDTNVYQPDVFFFKHKSKAGLGKRCIEGAPDFDAEMFLQRGRALFQELPKRRRVFLLENRVPLVWPKVLHDGPRLPAAP